MKLFTLIIISIFLLSNNLFAADSFGDLNDIFIIWVQGNLGKSIALIGFSMVFVEYIVMNMVNGQKAYNHLMIGSFIALIAGGLVGIANTFFNMGQSTFAIIP